MFLNKTEINSALILLIKRIDAAKNAHGDTLNLYGSIYLDQAKTLARVQLQMLVGIHPLLLQEEHYTLLSIICEKIEASGASIPLTNAVVLASDLSAAIGNQWNPPQPSRAKMVRNALTST